MSLIVLADSSPLSLEMTQHFFEERGHTVIACVDGIQAIQAVQQQRPRLLITETDLPPLTGGLLSRLVRSRRLAPQMMVAMYSGDVTPRRRLWAKAAGAELLVNKDEESLEAIAELLERDGAENSEPPAASVSAGGDTEFLTSERTIDLLTDLYDRELFTSYVVEQILRAASAEDSLLDTAARVLRLIRGFADATVVTLVIAYDREARIFVLPGEMLVRNDVEQFRQLCEEDFFRTPGTEAIRSSRETVLDVEQREDYDRVRLDDRRISSYYSSVLTAGDGRFVGTLHLGHLDNNYFTGVISHELALISRAAGTVLGDSVRFFSTDERRRKLNTIFAKFVPEEVIKDLLSQ